MIKLSEKGVFLASNNEIIAEEHFTGEIKKEEAKKSVIDLNFLKILDMKIPRHPASYKSKI